MGCARAAATPRYPQALRGQIRRLNLALFIEWALIEFEHNPYLF
jgi:hypothetical protein